jgi:hypothetical protein
MRIASLRLRQPAAGGPFAFFPSKNRSRRANDRRESIDPTEKHKSHPRPAGSRFAHRRRRLDEIGLSEKITRARTERILRDELRRRWVAPAQDFARLQIARLDGMILKLIDRIQRGELEAIDRALKIVDRLDRYHGFTRANRPPEQYGEEERARLMQKINDVAARLQANKPEE